MFIPSSSSQSQKVPIPLHIRLISSEESVNETIGAKYPNTISPKLAPLQNATSVNDIDTLLPIIPALSRQDRRETPTENPKSDSKEIVYQSNKEIDDDSDIYQKDDDVEFNYFDMHLQLIYPQVCIFTTYKKDDWRRIVIFHTLTKIENKNCKMIVDNESYINAVLSKVIEKVRLKVEYHPSPYKVSWINSTALDVKQRCLVPIDFELYKDKI